jgi:hypothetical protein
MEIRFCRRQAIIVFLQPMNGSVIDHFATVVTPGRVNDLPHCTFGHIPSHYAIEEAPSVTTGKSVFEQW